MLMDMLYLAHMSLPVWALLFLVLFITCARRRILSSFLFGVFSVLTYVMHIVPYLVVEKDMAVSLKDSQFFPKGIKLALLNDYTSSYLRDEKYLSFLWNDLKGRGFQGMIVREKQFSWAGESTPKESLRVFYPEVRKEADFRIAFTYPELIHFWEEQEDSPIIWMDLEGQGDSFLSVFPVPPDGQEMLYLSFQDTPYEWFSFLSKVDMTVIRF